MANGREMLLPHQVLGVEANADEATINSTFRRAAKKYHPDLRGGDAAGASELRLLIAARDRLISQHRKQLGQHRRPKGHLKGLARKYGVPAAAVLSFGFGFVFFATLKGSSAATEAPAVSREPLTNIQWADAGDAEAENLKFIRDWQEGYGTGESSKISLKKPEVRRNYNRPPDELRKAANGAVALFKDLRRRAFNR